ncbi:MAG: NYN domain-containing protein [Acidimicrobiales bacterium]
MAEPHHVVVDGSNLATEGRTLPSLVQLDEAVRAYAEEDPTGRITVVVDASFEHRVKESEREQVREALLNGELVSPPAGAIGRGDAFVLRIAERTGAVVLSNDSFQEFHGEHPWLFEEGRLIGGKPVPGVGWIFTPRLPVRGVKSRAATAEARAKVDPDSAPAKAAELARAAKKAAKRAPKEKAPVVETSWPLVPSEPPPARHARKAPAAADPALSTAIDEAVAEALDPPRARTKAKAPVRKKAAASKKVTTPKKVKATQKDAAKKAAPARKKAATTKAPADKAPKKAAAKVGAARTTRAQLAAAPPAPKKSTTSPPPAVNAPLSFINFVAAYTVGSTIEGEVVSFTSHGAMVDVALPDGGALHCYIPLSAMGNPPPIKAREVLTKGEVRPFVLAGLDPPRRVAELALPAPAPKKRRSRSKKPTAKSP